MTDNILTPLRPAFDILQEPSHAHSGDHSSADFFSGDHAIQYEVQTVHRRTPGTSRRTDYDCPIDASHDCQISGVHRHADPLDLPAGSSYRRWNDIMCVGDSRRTEYDNHVGPMSLDCALG